jgi:SOS response regulatory protein OraA/RecX
MTDDIRTLGQHFIGLYKFARLQQELLAKTYVQLEAVSHVAERFSENAQQELEAARAEAQANPTAILLAETLKVADATIQALEKQYGPSVPTKFN